jgi:hypothetical protein
VNGEQTRRRTTGQVDVDRVSIEYEWLADHYLTNWLQLTGDPPSAAPGPSLPRQRGLGGDHDGEGPAGREGVQVNALMEALPLKTTRAPAAAIAWGFADAGN